MAFKTLLDNNASVILIKNIIIAIYCNCLRAVFILNSDIIMEY